jgi:hypothetical protein
MSATMRMNRRMRSDAPTGKNLGETLGKSLTHHQVVPATRSADANHTSNAPLVNSRNNLLSGTGGLKGHIHQTHNASHRKYKVAQHSHTTGRMLQSSKPLHGVVNPSHATKGK